jgi:hypothetical protein
MLRRALILLLLALPARAAEPPVLLELFTSQGCSSCPPADRLLGKLAEREDVLALGFHVTYWNYIGWTDSFASEATTARQYAYAKSFGRPGVYTPQMVIAGASHEVGSDAGAIERAIAAARRRAGQVAVAFDGARVTVADGDGSGSLWLACYDAKHVVAVGRGENGGRKLAYFNVVRHLEKLGDWQGTALALAAPIEAQRAAGRDGCAAILQRGTAGPVLGPVLGAAKVRLTAATANR